MTLYLRVYENVSEIHFNVTWFSNSGETNQKRRKTMGQISPLVLQLSRTFTPQLDNNNTLKCNSDNFA